MAENMDGLSEEQHAAVTSLARQIAREEIASLSGLVLRRLQDHVQLTRSLERNMAMEEIQETFNAIFGEVLRDFSATEEEPGE